MQAWNETGLAFAVVVGVLLLLVVRAEDLLGFLGFLRRGFLLRMSSSGIDWLPDGQTHAHHLRLH